MTLRELRKASQKFIFDLKRNGWSSTILSTVCNQQTERSTCTFLYLDYFRIVCYFEMLEKVYKPNSKFTIFWLFYINQEKKTEMIVKITNFKIFWCYFKSRQIKR